MTRQEAALPGEIRAVLIPLYNELLLLPNAAVAEVIDFREPEGSVQQPDWFMGTLNWRQRDLPLVRLERLLGQDQVPGGLRQCIVVCHTHGAQARRPFVGIVAASIPRLIRVREELLEAQEMESGLPADLVHARLQVDGQTALIPDLPALERQLQELT